MNFSNLSLYKIILINFVLMIFWHLIVLVICRSLPRSFFNCKRFSYRPHKWEQNGKFYVKWLKIKKWKDRLPQYVATGGFSKRRLESFEKINKEYIGMFISETCRAEWNHYACSLYFIVSLLINDWPYSLIFSLIPVIANLPFFLIQRYNRLRLMKFSKKI